MRSAVWRNGFASRDRQFRWAALQSQDISFAASGTVLIGEGEASDFSNTLWQRWRGERREGN